MRDRTTSVRQGSSQCVTAPSTTPGRTSASNAPAQRTAIAMPVTSTSSIGNRASGEPLGAAAVGTTDERTTAAATSVMTENVTRTSRA